VKEAGTAGWACVTCWLAGTEMRWSRLKRLECSHNGLERADIRYLYDFFRGYSRLNDDILVDQVEKKTIYLQAGSRIAKLRNLTRELGSW